MTTRLLLTGWLLLAMTASLLAQANSGRIEFDVSGWDWHIEDPYFGRNLEKLRWVMDKEWWYTKQFNLPKEMRGKNLSLQFDGVDYQCEVWFNGTRLGAHEGMFSAFSFDVTKLADFEHQNRVMVRLAPPILNLSNMQGKSFSGAATITASPVRLGFGVRCA